MIDPRYPNRRRQESPWGPLGISLLLHLLLGMWVFSWRWEPQPQRIDPSSVMTVEYLPDGALIPGVTWLNPLDFQPEEEKPKEDPEEELRLQSTGGQVVELARPLEPQRPDQADYLAEHNSKVPEESVSQRHRINPAVVAPTWSPRDTPGTEGTGQKDITRPSTGTAAAGKAPEEARPGASTGNPTPFRGDARQATGHAQDAQKAADQGRLAWLPDRLSKYDLGKPERSLGQAGQSGGAGPQVRQGGSLAAAQRGLGKPQGAPTNDYLPDEKNTNATLLNAYEFKYAAFLNKVKRAVSFYADQTLNNARPGSPLTKNAYEITAHAMLDSGGRLESIRITKGSGIPEFDDALAQAFRLAAPFPTPPQGMIEGDGSVHIRDFLFHIDIGRAPSPMNGIDPRQGIMFPGLQTAPR